MKNSTTSSRTAILTGPLLLCLIASSVLVMGLLAGRIHYTNGGQHLSLVWDIFLAWVPLLPAWLLWRQDVTSRKSSLLLAAGLGTFWLLFFPNSPYLITEFVHLEGPLTPGKSLNPWLSSHLGLDGRTRRPPMWSEFLLFAATATAGLLLTFTSLRLVHVSIERRFGSRAATVSSGAFLLLAGFGIALGRIVRLNSWDALERPRLVYRVVRDHVLHAFREPQVPATAVVTGLLLCLIYVGMREIGQAKR